MQSQFKNVPWLQFFESLLAFFLHGCTQHLAGERVLRLHCQALVVVQYCLLQKALHDVANFTIMHKQHCIILACKDIESREACHKVDLKTPGFPFLEDKRLLHVFLNCHLHWLAWNL